jgi:hypothetical protein
MFQSHTSDYGSDTFRWKGLDFERLVDGSRRWRFCEPLRVNQARSDKASTERAASRTELKRSKNLERNLRARDEALHLN